MTKEQQAKAVEMREAHKAKLQERRKAKYEKRPSIDERLKKMANELELTEDQQSTMKKVFENTQAEIKTVKESEMELEEKRKAVREILEKQQTQIDEMLTKEQRKEMETLREQHQARRSEMQRRKHKGHHGKRLSVEERLEKMTTHLKLTDAQQSSIKSILENPIQFTMS